MRVYNRGDIDREKALVEYVDGREELPFAVCYGGRLYVQFEHEMLPVYNNEKGWYMVASTQANNAAIAGGVLFGLSGFVVGSMVDRANADKFLVYPDFLSPMLISPAVRKPEASDFPAYLHVSDFFPSGKEVTVSMADGTTCILHSGEAIALFAQEGNVEAKVEITVDCKQHTASLLTYETSPFVYFLRLRKGEIEVNPYSRTQQGGLLTKLESGQMPMPCNH